MVYFNHGNPCKDSCPVDLKLNLGLPKYKAGQP
jgi:hypothetical protein